MENAARIVVCGRQTFLVGNDIFTCADHKLSGANDSDDGEDSKRNCEITLVVVIIINQAAV